MKKNLIFLLIIFILAAAVRLVALDIRPVGFTWDEAALGYNAYSLLKTGRDEHQKVLPIVFESFGDYKPGAYIYLTVPSIAVFGVNEFATRLPSALLGAISVVLVFLLIKELFGIRYSLFGSLIMAANPWSIYFSRGAWEANVMVFLLILGAVLALRKKQVLASIFWGLTLWTYQGAKLITPLIILGYWVSFGERTLKNYWKPALILGIFAFPILWNAKTQSGRLEVASVFSYVRPPETVTRVMQQDNSHVGSFVYFLFHNEKLDQIRGITQRYLNHFSPRFLLMEGDWTSMRHSIAYYGYLHLPEALLLVLGFGVLFSRWQRGPKFIFWWLVVAAIPAALSRDLVSGVRSLPMTVPLVVIIGLGLSQLYKNKFLLTIYIIVMVFFLGLFADLYFKQSPNYRADERLTAYKPAIALVNKNINDYSHVIFTNKMGQPYIFVLFYNRVDPREFWQSVKRIPPVGVDVGEVASFGKWEFAKFYWPDTRGKKSTIVVGDELELPETDLHFNNLYRLGWIYYPNGTPALDVVGLK